MAARESSITGSDPFSVTPSDLGSPEMGHTMNVAIEEHTMSLPVHKERRSYEQMRISVYNAVGQ